VNVLCRVVINTTKQPKKKKKVTWKEIDRASKEMLTGYM